MKNETMYVNFLNLELKIVKFKCWSNRSFSSSTVILNPYFGALYFSIRKILITKKT